MSLDRRGGGQKGKRKGQKGEAKVQVQRTDEINGSIFKCIKMMKQMENCVDPIDNHVRRLKNKKKNDRCIIPCPGHQHPTR